MGGRAISWEYGICARTQGNPSNAASVPSVRLCVMTPAMGMVRATRGDRLIAAIVAVCCLAVLVVASRLSPSSDGHGTHTQLGLPPCGMYLAMGRPCPTCGMTTSFAALAHFRVGLAFKTQPFGALLGLATAATFWLSLHVLVFGSRIGTVATRLVNPMFLWSMLGIGLASWAYVLVRLG